MSDETKEEVTIFALIVILILLLLLCFACKSVKENAPKTEIETHHFNADQPDINILDRLLRHRIDTEPTSFNGCTLTPSATHTKDWTPSFEWTDF